MIITWAQAPGNAYDPKVPGLAFAFDYISPFNPGVCLSAPGLPRCAQCMQGRELARTSQVSLQRW